MKINSVGINGLQWYRYGTSLDIGFRYSVSNAEEDDWTLGETSVFIPNEDIDPLMNQIIERFKTKIYDAIHKEIEE